MYDDYYRFKLKPFSIAPDPSFLYLSERHREALAHLMYGLRNDGGFVLITGEVGTGKTTLVRSLIDEVPEDLDIAFVLNPRLTVNELLETLCEELGIPEQSGVTATNKHLIDRINRHLLRTHAMGRSTVVIIDEAQNLSPAVLEQIRLLTNLETNERKLVRIILLGQPELAEMLDRTRDAPARATGHRALSPRRTRERRHASVHRPPFDARRRESAPVYSRRCARDLSAQSRYSATDQRRGRSRLARRVCRGKAKNHGSDRS